MAKVCSSDDIDKAVEGRQASGDDDPEQMKTQLRCVREKHTETLLNS